ncbi:hypothetical protein EYC80_000343 [Monilinia laxa]|uniref:Uncharacterized protein n=1 Tax=Monilinia laxa TaxID=61186 RepID=A0A5N6KAC3_MONLA|nr:hypothetical protein EYC80_000343 [Monilinia laxa]
MSKDTFKAVFWDDASSERSATQSIAAIYAKVRESGDFCGNDEEKLEFVRAAVRMWDFRWLVVFDNYDTPDKFSLEDDDAAIELLGLPEKEALQLLYHQSGTKEIREKTEEVGIQVVKRLGYHALAIIQAGTYIKSLRLEFSAFESHFSSQRLGAILKYKTPMNKYTKSLNGSEREAALNVFATWGLSFSELKAQKNSAALEDFMRPFAFFDSADISEEPFLITQATRLILDDINPISEESEPGKYNDKELMVFKTSG